MCNASRPPAPWVFRVGWRKDNGSCLARRRHKKMKPRKLPRSTPLQFVEFQIPLKEADLLGARPASLHSIVVFIISIFVLAEASNGHLRISRLGSPSGEGNSVSTKQHALCSFCRMHWRKANIDGVLSRIRLPRPRAQDKVHRGAQGIRLSLGTGSLRVGCGSLVDHLLL